MERIQRLVLVLDAAALGVFSVGAGVVLDARSLLVGGAVLFVGAGLYGWTTRNR